MVTMFMNSGNSKTSTPHRLLLNLSEKINLKMKDKCVGKISKSQTKIINLKYQLRHGMNSLNYLMDYILYQLFKTILSISSKNAKQLVIILQ